ncbi:TPA: hypothetical protein ACK3Q6_008062 [Burkholderia cepacia]
MQSHTDIRALNYCSDAIDDIRNTVKSTRSVMPYTSQHASVLVDLLQNAVKFILPNCAALIDDFTLRESHLELFRLPYPVVAFEATWEKEGEAETMLNGYAQGKSSKRIALCWEQEEAARYFKGYNPFPYLDAAKASEVFRSGGVFVYPVYYDDKTRIWSFAAGGTFMPRDFLMTAETKRMPASDIIKGALSEVGRFKKAAGEFRAEPFILMPELFEALVIQGRDFDRALAQVALDSSDEVTAAVQACSVLNCANVRTSEVAPSRAANALRAAKGKRPFFTYKVLEVSADRGRGGSATGSHASPRMHLRRGHLRRLDGKVVWVRAAMVNAKSTDGVVAKDYSLPRSK